MKVGRGLSPLRSLKLQESRSSPCLIQSFWSLTQDPPRSSLGSTSKEMARSSFFSMDWQMVLGGAKADFNCEMGPGERYNPKAARSQRSRMRSAKQQAGLQVHFREASVRLDTVLCMEGPVCSLISGSHPQFSRSCAHAPISRHSQHSYGARAY